MLNAFERGEFKPVKNAATEIRKLRAAARAHLSRTKNINIRLSERTLHKLRVKAMEQGLPYQTLIASLLHQYTNR